MARKKKTADIKIRCEKEVKEQLSDIAQKEERSLSGQILFFLKRAIKDYLSGG